MDDKTKEDFIKLFNQGFEDLILPQFDELREETASLRGEVISIKSIMATKSDIDRLERKIDRINAKDMEQDRRLDRIEAAPAVAPHR